MKNNNYALIAESWKLIIYRGVDYTGLYEVSNMGRVRNLKTGKITIGNVANKTNNTNYRRVVLKKEGYKNQSAGVHRLVATAFIPNWYNYAIVNHIDGNGNHNMVANLEWIDNRGNQLHAYNFIKRTNAKIEKNKKFYEEYYKELDRLIASEEEEILVPLNEGDAPGEYFVSSFGRITKKNNINKFRRPFYTGGHMHYSLWKNGFKWKPSIKELMRIAFFPNVKEIKAKDNNKMHYSFKNLVVVE